jgi:ketosteroid isomerase-like protein
MKKIPLILLLSCYAISAFTQNVQQEINEQVWKPFIQAFNDRDTKSFMAVHSKDVVRSPRDSKVIWDWNEYYKQMERGDQSEKVSQSKRQLELRFTERIAGKDKAIDVGIYKTTMIRSDGIAKSFFGRFHVVHRKENGVWKILVDTDSSENNSISEKDFLAAAALE